MRLVSFNVFRSLGLPGVRTFKPEQLFAARDEILCADWVLFPETWQVNALAYGMKRRIFPSLASYHLGRDKIEMTRAFWSVCPEHVPRTLILPASEVGVAAAADELGFPLVAKEPRNSMGRGVFLVESERELARFAAGAECLYVQEYLPIDRDLRVTVVGDRVVASYWRIGGDGFRHNVARGGELCFDGIPAEAVELVSRIAAELGVDHAGFDVAMVDGRPLLLELNVLFGNQALNRLGIDTGPVILDYLERQTRPAAPPDQPTRPPLRLAS